MWNDRSAAAPRSGQRLPARNGAEGRRKRAVLSVPLAAVAAAATAFMRGAGHISGEIRFEGVMHSIYRDKGQSRWAALENAAGEH